MRAGLTRRERHVLLHLHQHPPPDRFDLARTNDAEVLDVDGDGIPDLVVTQRLNGACLGFPETSTTTILIDDEMRLALPHSTTASIEPTTAQTETDP